MGGVAEQNRNASHSRDCQAEDKAVSVRRRGLNRDTQAVIAGSTSRVSTVDVIRPPITTIAKGRCTAAPVPVASAIGDGSERRAALTQLISPI